MPLEAGIPVLDDDPDQITQADPYPLEDRYQTVGSPDGGTTILFVVSGTLEEDEDGELYGRIISVRAATRPERRAYEAAKAANRVAIPGSPGSAGEGGDDV